MHEFSHYHRVRYENSRRLQKELECDRVSSLETFNLKFMITGPDGKRENINARIKFEDGKPKCLLASKNESKIIIFDVLCLHR